MTDSAAATQAPGNIFTLQAAGPPKKEQNLLRALRLRDIFRKGLQRDYGDG
jgi:hypothetical protein